MTAFVQPPDLRNESSEGETEVSGDSLILELPDDVLSLLSQALQPRDLCNLIMTCKKLNLLCSSDKFWWSQCQQVTEISTDNLQAWRTAVLSCKVLCRFLLSVKPLIGIWVHQNPELGNMVYVMWGFLSVVGCRIIPQELGPLGFDSGLLWAPVFEVIGNSDGSLAFFLHGREKEKDYYYPGCLKPAKEDCNVLLLEAEPNRQSGQTRHDPLILDGDPRAVSAENGSSSLREDISKGVYKPGSRALKLQRSNETDSIQFSRLGFGDRRKLLELVARRVRLKVPPFASGPLFPRARHASTGKGNGSSLDKENMQKDLLLLSERRSLLIRMYKHGKPNRKKPNSGSHCDGIQSEIALRLLCNESESQDLWAAKDTTGLHSPKGKSSLEGANGLNAKLAGTYDKTHLQPAKKQSFAKLFKERMKQIIGMGAGLQDSEKGNSSRSGENKRVQLQDFLRLGDTVGLCLHASSLKLSMYRAWPIMHDNRFALYKMPEHKPDAGREHAGLWGATFGWPPGRPPVDKPGKALFFLLLSYEETEEGLLLIATKILEGTHYVLHPNGSAMFTARVNDPSSECFPWDTDRDAAPVEIVQAYQGEGIANGYGFRYPGSKPGDLFVVQKGLLAFVWRESKAVLTLQRLDLESLLKSGERVAALPPVANFAYLTKSYSNVFAGHCGGFPSSGPLPRSAFALDKIP